MKKNYELLFKKDEKSRRKWEQEYMEFIGQSIFDKTYNFNYDDTELYTEEDLIDTVILTLCDKYIPNFTKQKQIEYLELSEIITKYDIDINDKKGLIKIETTKGSIEVSRLNTTINKAKKYKIPFITNYNNLIELSKDLNFDNKIVTGYVFGFSQKSKKIHSWIEFTKNNKDFVIDLKYNFIMNKSAFYFLKHVEKINEISSNTLKDDEIIFNEFNKIINFESQEYLSFRDEIIKDIEKNKHLILK